MSIRVGLSTLEPLASHCVKSHGPSIPNVYFFSHRKSWNVHVPYYPSRRYLKNLTHTCSVPDRCKTNICDSHCVLNRDYKEECCKTFDLMKVTHISSQNILQYFHSLKSILRIWRKYDLEFRPKTFLAGSQQAVIQVSRLISEGNFKALEDLVTVKAIREIKANMNILSVEQRRQVAVDPENIIHKFIYDINLIESPLLSQSWTQEFKEIIPRTKAEILVVIEGSFTGHKKFWQSSDLSDKFFCNYKFEKTFDPFDSRHQSGWIITQLNHFIPKTQ